MSPPTNIDGTEITAASIDGQDVQEITVDGQTVFSAIPDSGVSRYTFDDADTESGTALDSWGDNDGTISGATTGVSGLAGYDSGEAYSFDGSNDNVDISGVTSGFTDGDPISYALWINPDDPTGATKRVSDIGDLQTATEGLSFFTSGGDLGAQIADGSRTTIGTTPVSGGTTYFICLTYDGSTATFYIDDATEVGTGTDAYTLVNEARVGSAGDDSRYWAGDADDPRVYSKALTSTEVSNLYNTGYI